MRLLIPIFLFAVAPAFAAPLAQVTAVQPPAWIKSGGQRVALAAGRMIIEGDCIDTGDHARVHVELGEGSIVKLGEHADFCVPRLARSDDEGGIFRSALKVLKGAFRFTTRALAKADRREVDVTIGVATAGVRGTDIWGKSDGEQDLIALLEGKIEVGSEGQPKQTMESAGTYYVVPRGAAPKPVQSATEKDLSKWVPQTEMVPDGIAMFSSGTHDAVIATLDNRAAAAKRLEALDKKGFAAQIVVGRPSGRQQYRILMHGFGSEAEARRFARHLRE